MATNRLHDAEWLYEKYHNDGLTQSEIADLVGCDSSTVSRAMSDLDMKTRAAAPKVKYPELHDSEWVKEKYIDEYKTTGDIAEILGCGRSHAIRAVNKHVPDEQIRDSGPQGNLLDNPLSDREWDFIVGELLGDGCIRTRFENPRTATYKHATSREGYRDWLNEWFQDRGFETRTYTRESEDPAGNTHLSYRLETKQYRCLKEMYDRWYPNGEKRVPSDIDLTPVMLRQWFIGDGTNSSNLMLYTDGFTREGCETLVAELESKGIVANVNSRNQLQLYRETGDRFFEYMAALPSELEDVYGYKWPNNG